MFVPSVPCGTSNKHNGWWACNLATGTKIVVHIRVRDSVDPHIYYRQQSGQIDQMSQACPIEGENFRSCKLQL